MKILHVCETVKGGLASYLNELVPQQQRQFREENVSLLIPDAHADCLAGMEAGSIRTFKRANRKTGLLHLAIKYIKVMRELRPDIVHVHSTFAGVAVRMMRPLFFSTPIVYCPHGWAMDMEQSGVRKAIVTRIERLLSLFCDKIIAISEYERRCGINAGIADSKIVTIHNAIAAEPPAFDPVVWQGERLKVLFIGRFDRQKGIDVLLEALAPVQDQFSVRLIGGAVGDEEDVDFDKYPFAQRTGWLDAPEISAYLHECDVVAVPSRWEGFGLVAIEAMRMGKPVIASDIGGLSEIVVHGKTGFLVPPGDAEALRDAFCSLENGELEQMGRAGRERFDKNFQRAEMINNITSLYKTVK